MWKFHDFAATHILREINFWDSRSAKSAILTHLEALNFDFHGFLHFLKAEMLLNEQNSEPLELQKAAVLEFLDTPKLISRKN